MSHVGEHFTQFLDYLIAQSLDPLLASSKCCKLFSVPRPFHLRVGSSKPLIIIILAIRMSRRCSNSFHREPKGSPTIKLILGCAAVKVIP